MPRGNLILPANSFVVNAKMTLKVVREMGCGFKLPLFPTAFAARSSAVLPSIMLPLNHIQ